MGEGHGLNLKREHFDHLLEHGPGEVDWFEIISENFFVCGGRPWAVLEELRSRVPIGVHGTAMGLGDPEGVSEDYLRRLERLVQRLQPVRISDHLCFVSAGGHHTHELLPLPHTRAAAQQVADQIQRVQERLKRRIAVENISTYLTFEGAEMGEADFVAEVVDRADCGLLLDLGNILVNAHNHGLDAEAYIARMPADRVEELHLAGASPGGDLLIDTHLGPVPDSVWSLYRFALDRIGPRPTLVEWDAGVPSYATAAAECGRARAIERHHRAVEEGEAG